MTSDGVMNRRHGSLSVPRGVKRPAEMQGSGKSSPKRAKTADGVESSLMVMHPPEVLSHADSSPMSSIVEPATSSVVNGTSLRDMVPSNDAIATLPTLPTSLQLVARTSTNVPKPVEHVKGSLPKEENRKTKIASRMVETLNTQSAACCREFVPENGHRRQTCSSSCKRLFGIGAVALLLVGTYRSSSFHRASFLDKKIALSNFTVTEMTEVKVDRALHRPPRRPSSLATSPHLLAIDNYERLKSTLAMVKNELAKAMVDLDNSRKNVGTAREEVTSARNDYARVVSELEQTKNELMDKQRRIGVLLQELNYTQEELEHTRRSLQVLEVELKATSDELDAAHVTIDDLHHLLQVQETVAVHALNFVVTTAVNRQYKCGGNVADSKQQGRDATNVEL